MSVATLDIQTEAKQRFLALFSAYEQTLNGQKSNPLHNIRKKGIESLQNIGFPTLRNEDWKYTSVSRILQEQYALPTANQLDTSALEAYRIGDAEMTSLVFVNGLFAPDLSKDYENLAGVQIQTLEAAMKDEAQASAIYEQFGEKIASSDNAFVHLNAAFVSNGLFIKVAKNAVVEKPIHILHIHDGSEQAIMGTALQLVQVEAGAEVCLLESFHSVYAEAQAESYFMTCNTLIEQGKQSKVKYYKLQQLSNASYLVHHARVDQERDSTFTTFTADLGARVVRNNVSAIHKGENVLSNLYGIFIGKGERHVDNQTLIDHAIPHCQSNEWYKGILDDKSRGVFNGKVMVRQDAQKTNAFQQNNALILSENARMDTKPQLEIFADDVRCSHGATIGQMNEDAVFYLRSRGLSEKEARELLQLAFIQEVSAFIEDDFVKAYMERHIQQNL